MLILRVSEFRFDCLDNRNRTQVLKSTLLVFFTNEPIYLKWMEFDPVQL